MDSISTTKEVVQVNCRVCGDLMVLKGYFPEPETTPNPVSNYRCGCGHFVKVHHMASKAKAFVEERPHYIM